MDSVNITVTGNENASVGADNLDTTAASVGATETATLTLTLPGPSDSVDVVSSLTDNMSLAAYDGTVTFAGPSREVDQGLTATASTSSQLISGLDLAPFIGTGSLLLPLSAVGSSSLSGPANLLTQLLQEAGATVTISYTYAPGADAPCFATGTRIATTRGDVAVEAIAVGEKVRVLLGDGLAEVIWVGRREVECARHPQPRNVWPVRVAAGAFGPGLPHSDLYLSPDHAVYVNEVLIPVKYLINGSTIGQVPVGRVTYWHLEFSRHNIVLAEGLPTESFLDLQDGSNFANRPGPVRLYPDFSARMWEAYGCAPLVVTGPHLKAARALVARCLAARIAA